jgi:chorismate dehydratase
MSARPRHRIGAVSFLNTVPLIHGLEGREELRLLRDLPGKLADRLYEGQIDVGLIPVVEYLRGVGGDIVPGICIGAEGAVHSVKVFSKRPIEEAQTIAVDRGSRSSVALLRILLAELHDHHPDLHTIKPRATDPFLDHDSVLVIGDRAMQIPTEGLQVYDLGAMWHEMTGLPFVFAAWVLSESYSEGASNPRRDELIQLLHAAKREGLEHLGQLARQLDGREGLSADELERYWRDSIRYDMGERELAGLERFAELARQHRLCSGREAVNLAVA